MQPHWRFLGRLGGLFDRLGALLGRLGASPSSTPSSSSGLVFVVHHHHPPPPPFCLVLPVHCLLYSPDQASPPPPVALLATSSWDSATQPISHLVVGLVFSFLSLAHVFKHAISKADPVAIFWDPAISPRGPSPPRQGPIELPPSPHEAARTSLAAPSALPGHINEMNATTFACPESANTGASESGFARAQTVRSDVGAMIISLAPEK